MYFGAQKRDNINETLTKRSTAEKKTNKNYAFLTRAYQCRENELTVKLLSGLSVVDCTEFAEKTTIYESKQSVCALPT